MYFEDFERNCTIPIPPAQIEKEEMLVFVLENAIFKYERYPIRNQEKNYE